jgi:hypothetical protein
MTLTAARVGSASIIYGKKSWHYSTRTWPVVKKILGYDLQDKNQRIHGRMCAYGQ